MIKQSNLYSFNVPMQSGFEETHKTQPTSGQNSALAYWLHILILISDSTISLLRIYRSSLNRGRWQVDPTLVLLHLLTSGHLHGQRQVRSIWFVGSTAQSTTSCRNSPQVIISSESFQAITFVHTSCRRPSFKLIPQFTAFSTQETLSSSSKRSNLTAELEFTPSPRHISLLFYIFKFQVVYSFKTCVDLTYPIKFCMAMMSSLCCLARIYRPAPA